MSDTPLVDDAQKMPPPVATPYLIERLSSSTGLAHDQFHVAEVAPCSVVTLSVLPTCVGALVIATAMPAACDSVMPDVMSSLPTVNALAAGFDCKASDAVTLRIFTAPPDGNCDGPAAPPEIESVPVPGSSSPAVPDE